MLHLKKKSSKKTLIDKPEKGFQCASMSRQAIIDTSSALRWSRRQLLFNFSDESGTHQAMPQFMKVWRVWKKKQKKVIPSLKNVVLKYILTGFLRCMFLYLTQTLCTCKARCSKADRMYRKVPQSLSAEAQS